MGKRIDRKAMAERLKDARISAGYKSAAAFARKMGMVEHTYNCYEKGERAPAEYFMRKICAGLNIDADWLLYGTGEKPPEVPAAGKHEAGRGNAGKKASALAEQNEPGLKNVLELVDAIDDMDPILPGYLVDGSALREALHGDPNGDEAPAYLAMLCSKPAVVNYYRDRTHMRELNSAGTISNVEYRDWFIGRRELLRMTPINPPEKCRATGMKCDPKPILKCTSEKP